MVGGKQSQQQWEFSRDCPFDPSSNFGGMPIIEKHKVPNLARPKTVKAEDISRFQHKGRYASGMGDRIRVERCNKRKIGLSGKEDGALCSKMRMRPPHKENNKTKSISSAHMPATLDDTRILMNSILEELKVARENMLMWMREEMSKVMSGDTTPGPMVMKDDSNKQDLLEVQHQERFETGSVIQNCNGGTLVGSVKCKKRVNSCTGDEVLGNQAPHFQTILSMTSTEIDTEKFNSSVKGSPVSVSPDDQIGSSMYLTLPTVLPDVCVENQRFVSPSCDFLARDVENRMALNIGKAKLILSSSIHPGSFPRDQEEEKFGSITQIGSHNLGYIGQNKLALGSSLGSGFPIPFSRGLDGGFKIQPQASVQNRSQVQENNIFGLSMNGGIRSFGEGHGLSELNVACNLRNHVSSKAQDCMWTQENLIPSSQRELAMHELLYLE